jgi:hypothetical protein
MRGAGGTEGGVGRFLIGLAMFLVGGYLLLASIHVTSGFGLGHGLYNFGWGSITTGMVLVPFIFGVGFIFYNSKSLVGWALAGGSLLALVFGVVTSVRLTLRAMSAFELLTILVLVFGGLGLFLSSLREARS